MARGRRPARPGQAWGDLPRWPLDPPTVATAAHGPTVPGATRPGVRTFFCKHCRTAREVADPPDGWLRVQLRDAATQQRDGRTFVTAGLFCGLPCLTAWATTPTEVTP